MLCGNPSSAFRQASFIAPQHRTVLDSSVESHPYDIALLGNVEKEGNSEVEDEA
jgi:hypothetical protein